MRGCWRSNNLACPARAHVSATMDRPCSVNAAVAGSTRPAASRSARPAPRASVPRGGDLSARRSMTARFHAAPPAISLRRSTGRVSTGARAQSEQNENESKGADAGLSQGVPAGFYRACVDNSAFPAPGWLAGLVVKKFHPLTVALCFFPRSRREDGSSELPHRPRSLLDLPRLAVEFSRPLLSTASPRSGRARASC